MSQKGGGRRRRWCLREADRRGSFEGEGKKGAAAGEKKSRSSIRGQISHEMP